MFLIMISLAISLIIVIFSLQNAVVVPIVFFNWSAEVPLVIVIFASVFAGAAIIFCLALWKELKRKFEKVSTKATVYKGKLESKKDAFNAKLESRKAKKESEDPALVLTEDPIVLDEIDLEPAEEIEDKVSDSTADSATGVETTDEESDPLLVADIVHVSELDPSQKQ